MGNIDKLIKEIDKNNNHYELNEDDSFFIDIEDEFGEGIMYESYDQRLHIVGNTGDQIPYLKRLYINLNDSEKKGFRKYLENRFNIIINNVSTYDD